MKNIAGPMLLATAVAVFVVGFAFSRQTPTAWQNAPITSSARDAIPFRNVNGAMYVYANLGGVPHNMLLDTGASGSQITVPIANALLARKQATIVPGIFTTTIANGSVVPSQRVVVHTMRIGRHTLHDVEMIVADDGGAVLLGLSELRAIGSFTVDQSRSQIRFD
jgi:predicted aspartyl protease